MREYLVESWIDFLGNPYGNSDGIPCENLGRISDGILGENSGGISDGNPGLIPKEITERIPAKNP